MASVRAAPWSRHGSGLLLEPARTKWLLQGADVLSSYVIDWPDTYCATHVLQSVLSPDRCAMISRSVGHGARLVFLPRLAGRSTPMTGIDRSSLACRILLFLFVLLAVPMAARSATLEDSARELARKIAAALPANEGISIEVRSASSLSAAEVAKVEQAIKGELENQGFHSPVNGVATVSVGVTLSENVKGHIWIAEIQQGDTSRVVSISVSRSSENRAVSDAMPMVLRSEKFWEGSDPILDATVIPGVPLLLLLHPDGLEFREIGNDSATKVEIPAAEAPTRLPNGWFIRVGSVVEVMLDMRVCSVALFARELVKCRFSGERAARDPPDFQIMPTGYNIPSGKGDQLNVIRSACGSGNQVLTSGTGDYTQSDIVQAFDGGGVAVSNELNFPGPVLALNALVDAPTAATAVVRNLKTRNYEAYRLSISCGQ
jgi:hypothetical protein